MSIIFVFLSHSNWREILMVSSDYSHLFKCPKCGTTGAIYFLKVSGGYMIIKQKCPQHGGRSFKIPMMQKNQVLPYINNAVFRCFKCAAEAKSDSIKMSGPWAVIKVHCPTHGNNVPTHKIWGLIYNEMAGTPSAIPVSPAPPQRSVTTHLPSSTDVKVIYDVPPFCPYCKAPLNKSKAKQAGPTSVICPFCDMTVSYEKKEL